MSSDKSFVGSDEVRNFILPSRYGYCVKLSFTFLHISSDIIPGYDIGIIILCCSDAIKNSSKTPLFAFRSLLSTSPKTNIAAPHLFITFHRSRFFVADKGLDYKISFNITHPILGKKFVGITNEVSPKPPPNTVNNSIIFFKQLSRKMFRKIV